MRAWTASDLLEMLLELFSQGVLQLEVLKELFLAALSLFSSHIFVSYTEEWLLLCKEGPTARTGPRSQGGRRALPASRP